MSDADPSRRDALLAIDGVGEATADRIEGVVAETGPDIEAAQDELEDVLEELTRNGGGGKTARINRAQSRAEAAAAALGGDGER